MLPKATLPLVLLLATALAAGAAPRDGVVTIGDDFVRPSVPLSQPRVLSVIDFDDAAQPCYFSETTALRDEYASFGVTFSGPGPLDGGAVLDACGSFGVDGYSAPNFLAFNCGASLNGGGTPAPPERLTFDSPVSFVQIYVGSGSGAGATLSMEAFDDADQLVGVSSVVLSTQLQPMSVASPNIRYVVLGGTFTPCVWVGDDLAFEFSSVDVDPSTWAGTKELYR